MNYLEKLLNLDSELRIKVKYRINLINLILGIMFAIGTGFTGYIVFPILSIFTIWLILLGVKDNAPALGAMFLVFVRQILDCMMNSCFITYDSWVDISIAVVSCVLFIISFLWYRTKQENKLLRKIKKSPPNW